MPVKLWSFRTISQLIISFALLAMTFSVHAYQQIDWVELIPEDDLEALMNPPDYLDQIEDGSFEDQIASQMLNALEQSTDNRYQQALTSTQVVDRFDQQKIRMPGFVVPVEFNARQQVTAFFLVPYFGACIHYPPPPPNQIIYVTAKEGLAITDIYEPYWVEGTLSTTLTENELAISAYAIQADNVILYTEENQID